MYIADCLSFRLTEPSIKEPLCPSDTVQYTCVLNSIVYNASVILIWAGSAFNCLQKITPSLSCNHQVAHWTQLLWCVKTCLQLWPTWMGLATHLSSLYQIQLILMEALFCVMMATPWILLGVKYWSRSLNACVFNIGTIVCASHESMPHLWTIGVIKVCVIYLFHYFISFSCSKLTTNCCKFF